MQMDKNESLISAVLECAKEVDGAKKLSCAEAFKLARECGAEIIEIGRICNRQHIRICNCQLGCFK